MAALLGPRAFGALLLTLYLLGLSPPAFAQNILYEYDALGRLVVVASPEGASRFEYDSVGNLLRIITRRASDTPDPVAIFMLVPDRGPVGTEVHLYGKGFGETPSANQVAFNGTAAPVTSASATRLVVTVPAGATTGPVTVTAPGGSATSLDPFTVTQQLAVTPKEADVALGGLFGFQATLDGAPTNAVTWWVGGIEGGSSAFGTISASGTYTAPATMPTLQPLTVEAVLGSEPAQTARATVRVVPRVAGLLSTSPLSVAPATVPGGLTAANAVSVAPAATPPALLGTGPVSVTVAVSALDGAMAGPVSLTAGPVVSGVTPPTAVPGATGLALTLTGSNLGEVTTVQVLRNGAGDPTVSVSLAPGGAATTRTGTLTVSGSAPLGARTVYVLTPPGPDQRTSSAFDLGGNRLTITAP